MIDNAPKAVKLLISRYKNFLIVRFPNLKIEE